MQGSPSSSFAICSDEKCGPFSWPAAAACCNRIVAAGDENMKVAIRKIGNSQGVVLPKPVLAQAGLEGEAELTVEDGAIVLRKPARPVRVGWAAAAKRLAEHGDDALVMGEFTNEGDAARTW